MTVEHTHSENTNYKGLFLSRWFQKNVPNILIIQLLNMNYSLNVMLYVQ